MLCVDCAAVCERCRKMICPVHVHETTHGRRLCIECMEERQARREKRKAKRTDPESTAIDALQENLEADAGRSEKLVKDDYVPIYVASGWQPPSKKTYAIVFIIFGLVGILLLTVMPDVEKILWPFEAKGPSWHKNEMPVIRDKNYIRNRDNADEMNVFFYVPFFLLAWGFLLTYIAGVIAIVYAVTRGFIYRLRGSPYTQEE